MGETLPWWTKSISHHFETMGHRLLEGNHHLRWCEMDFVRPQHVACAACNLSNDRLFSQPLCSLAVWLRISCIWGPVKRVPTNGFKRVPIAQDNHECSIRKGTRLLRTRSTGHMPSYVVRPLGLRPGAGNFGAGRAHPCGAGLGQGFSIGLMCQNGDWEPQLMTLHLVSLFHLVNRVLCLKQKKTSCEGRMKLSPPRMPNL